ncbi:DUF6452 family protein [Aquimarina addita]|uniref:DUF6452 family protein n=1 Tax=Aquimarina addita TaxID=870485 RepID=A0ABP6UUL8_9FLAO
MIINNTYLKVSKTALLFIGCFAIVYFSASCERDDICPEDAATTPQVIIKFIDFVTALDINQPVDLEVRSADPAITDVISDVTSLDSILIPLKTDASITQLIFTTNATSEDESLIRRDTIDFLYTPQEEYVNSACGFRVNYLGLEVEFTRDNSNIDFDEDKNWIRNIIVQQRDITDETNAHVLFLH